MATRSYDARGLVSTLKLGLITASLAVAGCRGGGGGGEPSDDGGVISLSKAQPAAGATALPDDPATMPRADGPRVGAVQMGVTIYEKPDPRSEKLGYLRIGGTLPRGDKPVKFDTCRGGYYRVLPKGYVCVDEGASLDLNHPILKAGIRPPDRSKPLPYDYAFVRAIAPRYYRLPTKKEQFQYEMALDRHVRSFKRLGDKWNSIEVGSNDVPIDAQGRVLGDAPAEPPVLTEPQKFGGDAAGTIPWFFEGGRQIPNVSSFAVPDYAVITNRVARHAGLSLVGAIEGDDRLFALTTDLRLVPASKLKPGRGSTFHGVELAKGWEFPMAFVKTDDAFLYERKRNTKKKTRLALFTPVQLTGEVRGEGEDRMVEANDGDWLKSKDLAIIVKSSSLPSFVKDKTRWIDVSIQQQTLVLYEGSKPVFATMVSTGRDGLGDPKKTYSTPRGTFRIREKHVTTTMDSDVVGSEFELQDVPYVQYFQHGYALHASYWHTDYGRPRSHGCINMSPIDAMRAFWWTDPPVPEGWHGARAGESFGEGTIINIHP
jgi:lipoprotein-anchoring transpeptidase ErfK/SrfK